MNNIMHQQLNQLRVISLFCEGDKAKLENGFLTVEDKGWLSWVRRQSWLHPLTAARDSKEETVRYLQQFYISIYQSAEQIVLEVETLQKHDRKYNKTLPEIVSLAEKVHASITGIENLSKTYRFYPKQCAELRGIIDDYIRPAVQMMMMYIPLELLPKDLMSDKRPAPDKKTAAVSTVSASPVVLLPPTNSSQPSITLSSPVNTSPPPAAQIFTVAQPVTTTSATAIPELD